MHILGCPVFILGEINQSGMIGTPKWGAKTRLGVYLRHSPPHTGNLSLVLHVAKLTDTMNKLKEKCTITDEGNME